jgi:adenylylsulfate kinase
MADPSRGFTVWLTGLPCSGKSTIAAQLADCLRSAGKRVEVLDGDVIRTNLSRGLGFSREDRDINVRRIGFVAHLLSRNGVVVIVAAVSPYARARTEVREQIIDFVEVHVECPIAECERRDVKGMYAKARAGQLPHFTGVDDPYEPPIAPEVSVHTQRETPEQSAEQVLLELERRGYFRPAAREEPTQPAAVSASFARS